MTRVLVTFVQNLAALTAALAPVCEQAVAVGAMRTLIRACGWVRHH
jgi:hypothetical protein